MNEIAERILATSSEILASAVKALPWIAIIFGFRAYSLKRGTRVRGSFTTTSSVACDDKYVSRVVLTNEKDRALTIFAVYLKLGHNIYILLEDFDHAPMILKGFETVTRNYDPIERYAFNLDQVKIDSVWKDSGITKKLVLSTAEGKYIVKRPLIRWNPIHLFFRNYLTRIIYPKRALYKGKAYGGNALYVVELRFQDGSEQVTPIYPRDFEIQKFYGLDLTEESLSSKKALEAYLDQKRKDGTLTVTSIVIHDIAAIRKERLEKWPRKVIEARRIGFLTYNVIGLLLTAFQRVRLRMENRRRTREKPAEGE